MASSSQYGPLTPIQQYNQLAFQPIPTQPTTTTSTQPHPQPHPHQHPHPHPQQQQYQQHQPPHQSPPAPASATAPASAYQQAPSTTLPPNNTIAQQRHSANANSNVIPNASPSASTVAAPGVVSNNSHGNRDGSAPPQAKRRRVGRPPKSQAARDSAAVPPPLPRAPVEHTPHPLNKGPYDTAEDAVFSLQLHVFTSGYGVSQKRTVKEKLPSGRYDPDGDVIRKDFACDRGGNEFVSQSTGERRRESRKCGCPWKAVVRRLKREGDRWFVEVLDPSHNHPVTPPDQMHTIASYRRWQRDNNAGIRNAITRLARAAAMPARHVASYLKGDVADPDLDRVDRHILRALSMSDAELPSGNSSGDSASQSAVVFDVIARRPTIVLQDGGSGEGGGGGGGSSGTLESYMSRYGQAA
ncbi:hypothetical protein AAE478_007249 [Parahypoxylon ruwenzoriense]